MSLKKIELDGVQMEYEVFYDCSEHSDFYWTEFYIGKKLVTKRKYGIFGKKITNEVPFKVFELGLNIEDPSYTKKEIRHKIRHKLELLSRRKQIERGEII